MARESPPPPGPVEASTIDIRVREISQLFNSLDATPFPATDLDAEAEEFIIDWAMEFRATSPLRIRIFVEDYPPLEETRAQTATALRSFFAYRADIVQRRFRLLLARGRLMLVIGMTCLAASIAGAQLLSRWGESTLFAILQESLLIGGWVAMWGPLEVLLYDWWPLRHEWRICQRLSEAEIEIIPDTGVTGVRPPATPDRSRR